MTQRGYKPKLEQKAAGGRASPKNMAVVGIDNSEANAI
jgi:hypothetical protein